MTTSFDKYFNFNEISGKPTEALKTSVKKFIAMEYFKNMKEMGKNNIKIDHKNPMSVINYVNKIMPNGMGSGKIYADGCEYEASYTNFGVLTAQFFTVKCNGCIFEIVSKTESISNANQAFVKDLIAVYDEAIAECIQSTKSGAMELMGIDDLIKFLNSLKEKKVEKLSIPYLKDKT